MVPRPVSDNCDSAYQVAWASLYPRCQRPYLLLKAGLAPQRPSVSFGLDRVPALLERGLSATSARSAPAGWPGRRRANRSRASPQVGLDDGGAAGDLGLPASGLSWRRNSR